MKRLVLLLALCCTVVWAKDPDPKKAKESAGKPAASQPSSGPASDASIRELFDLLRVPQQLNEAFAEGEQQLKESTTGGTDPYGLPLNPTQQAALERCKTSVSEFLRKELDWAKLEPQLLRLYRETYTQAQLDDILSFLKSPTGVAFRKNEAYLEEKLAKTMIKPIQEKLALYLIALVTDLQNNSDYVRPDQRG
jgi:hypothetical protein